MLERGKKFAFAKEVSHFLKFALAEIYANFLTSMKKINNKKGMAEQWKNKFACYKRQRTRFTL